MIYETTNYEIVVGESQEKGVKGNVYHARNKDTTVWEIETRILPQMIDFVNQLQSAIDNPRDVVPPEPMLDIPFAH